MKITLFTNSKNHFSVPALAWLALIFPVVAMIGCGSGPQEVDKEYVAKQTDRAKTMREIFDRANGDYASTSDADKATLLKLNANNQKEVDRMWDQMAHPPGGAPVGPKA